MNNNSSNHRQPNDPTPLNGRPSPDARLHLEGFTEPHPGFEADDSEFHFIHADGFGPLPPMVDSLTGDEPDGTPPTSATASVDSAPLQEAQSASAATPFHAPAELLPSAVVITSSKLSYYNRLAEAPRLDLDFIKAEARAGTADGEFRVAEHHRHLCRMARAGLRQTLVEKRLSLTHNLQHLADDIQRTRCLLGGTRQFDDVPGAQPTLDWSISDRLGAVILTAFTLAGVSVDFFTWATILRQNDAHFYHNPTLAFFFGAVPLAFPLSLKVLLGGAQEHHGDRMLGRAAWCGVVASLATIAFFTLGHDGLSEVAAHGFGSLSGSAASPEAFDWKPVAQKASSVFLMVVAALFSAMCGHLLAGMFKRRRRASRVANPQYQITARNLAGLQEASHTERETLGAVTGKIEELGSEEAALVGGAVNYYRALRTVYTQTEQQLAELLNVPGVPQVPGGKRLRKGGHFLAIALVTLGLGLAACDHRAAPAAGSVVPVANQPAKDVVFGLGQGLTQQEREQVFRAAGDLALRDLPAGGSLEIWDAYELRRIAAFRIPEDEFYVANPVARQKLAVAAMQELKGFLASPAGAGDASTRILMPQFIEAISHQAHPSGMVVLLAGSAFYNHPRDPAWNLVDRSGRALNAFPTDGHLRAAPEVTPFSTRDRAQALAGVVLHIATVHDEFPSEAQRQGLTRFYALWVKSQSGVLATFSRDLGVAIDNLRHGTRTPVLDPTPHVEEDKPELREIRVQRVQRAQTAFAPETFTGVPVGAESILVPVSEAERSKTPPPSSFIVRDLSVGARWTPHLDIDVHGIHHPGAKPLYFGCPQTEAGEFHKDFQDAPPGIHGFERITFNQATDLRQLEIALNLYRGTAPGGVDVTVQITTAGHRYERVFHIAASEGNRGASFSGRAHDPHWFVIGSKQIAEMCGLQKIALAQP